MPTDPVTLNSVGIYWRRLARGGICVPAGVNGTLPLLKISQPCGGAVTPFICQLKRPSSWESLFSYVWSRADDPIVL